jgi:hypothetical protein
VKNSSAFCAPATYQMPALNASARATQTTVQAMDSLKATTWALRWNTPRSIASIASTKRLNPIHSQLVSLMV